MHRNSLISLATLLAVTIVAPGCADRTMQGPDQLDPRVLYDFESCDDLLGYAKSNAKDIISQYGNPWGYPEENWAVDGGFGEDAGLSSGEGDTGAASTGDPSGGDPVGDSGGGDGGGEVDHSGTNVQEIGVDEPDLVKTDGERILAIAQGKLHFVDASGLEPVKRGSLELGDGGHDAQIFMHEDRALLLLRTYVYGEGYYGGGDEFPGEFPGEQPAPPPGLDLAPHFPEGVGSIVRLVEVDLTDPDNLRIVSNLYLNGDMVNARLIDGVARVVVRSAPTGLVFKDAYEFMNWDAIPDEGIEPGTTIGSTSAPPSETGEVPVPGTSTTSGSPTVTDTSGANQPAPDGDAVSFREEPLDPYQVEWNKAKQQAKLYNLAIVENSTVDDWLPHFVREDLSQGEAVLTKGRLLDCLDVRHPGSYSGLSTLSVLTVDLDKALALGKGVGVFADGETVYASKANLYVTTSPWRPQQWTEEDNATGLSTFVHKFSLASAEKAEYVASGEVRGRVRSQWSLSEWEGDLRIATTDQQSWDSATSENFVSVLRQAEDELIEIGQVGGLGKGEEIQGVRFIAGVGYVVTFRQTDPLYTIDLHDPTKPVAVGELKIPGYSAYLHPVGEDLLLGVGFDGTEEGTLLGLQLSLFDVSDLKAPKRIHTAALGEAFGWSEAIFDHKAFLYWGKSKLALLPIESYSWDEVNMVDNSFSGAVGYTVDAEAGILPVGEITHTIVAPNPDEYYYAPPIRRSLVIGDRVLTLSDTGLKSSLLGDLSDASWIAF